MTTDERSRVIQLAGRFLVSGTSVNLTGLRGSGRSSIVRAIADAIRADGRTVVEISGLRAIADRPFAALALADIAIPPQQPAGSVVASMTTALQERLRAPGTVLVVDDADDLDPSSVGVIVAAALRAGAPLLTATRPGGRRQQELGGFVAQLPPGVRLKVPPLDQDAVNGMVREQLGAPVDSVTLATIVSESGGLPGLVAAIVQVAQVGGRLTRAGTTWNLAGAPWDPMLAQTLEPLLVDLTPEGLDGLELLAWSGVITLDRARDLIGADVLAQLDDAGLTQILHLAGDSFVAVYPPLLGDYLWRGTPPVRAALTAERTGQPADTARPASAVRGAGRLFGQRFREQWTAELRARRAEWERQPDAAHAIPLLAAMSQLAAEASSLAEVLDATRDDGASPDETMLLAGARATFTALGLDDLDGAIRLLRRRGGSLAGFDGFARAVAGHLTFLVDRAVGLDALEPGDGDNAESAAALATVRIEQLLAGGQTTRARALLDATPVQEGWFRVSLELSQSLTLIAEARLVDAIALSRAQLEAAQERLDAGAIEAHSYALALALTYSGRFDELARHLETVLAITHSPFLQRHLRQGVLVLSAWDANWRGRRRHAHSIVTQAALLTAHPGPYPGMHAPAALIGSAAFDDDDDADVVGDALWAAIEDRAARGYTAHAVALAVWSLERWPRAERLLAAAEWSDATTSPMLKLLGVYLRALAAADPDSLLEAASVLHEAGFGLHSLRSRIAAARASHARGEQRRAFQIASEAWSVMVSSGIGIPGLFAPLVTDLDLSERERDVAERVRQGATNAAIAEELVLSVRTVENHVWNVLRKVGADGRDDLAAAAETWLSLAATDELD